MNSVLKTRTITEILASRSHKGNKSKKQKTQGTSLVEVPHEWKLETLLKKTTYNNQDKIALIRYIEKKYRVRFGIAFAVKCFNWVVEAGRSTIDKHYDSTKRSMFVVKGKITLYKRGHALREMHLRQTNTANALEEICTIQQGGLGCVFSVEQSHHNLILVAENAVLLSIEHSQQQLLSLQRKCLMTTEQKQSTLKTFPMFRSLTSLNKYYTPYFTTRLYCKGQMIYNIGEEAQYLYLVVEGQIELESRVPVENPEIGDCISELTLRNSYVKYLSVHTEAISKSSFFGQQELIQLCERRQNARCMSINALMILVPLQKFTKLMYYNQIRDIFISTAEQRQQQREQTIAAALSLQNYKLETLNNNLSERSSTDIDFKDLNKQIYKDKNMLKEERKISLPGQKYKIVHGNPIKLNRYSKTKPERFSMLEVNRIQYEVSAKRFKLWNSDQKKRNMTTTQSSFKTEKEGDRPRSLKQVWQVLKLDHVLQEEGDRLHLQNREGKIYYKAHMKLLRHLGNIKGYRPSTTSTSTRAKSQYLEYLQKVVNV